MDPIAVGQAFYLQAEVLRLRGAFADAEESYRTASRFGWEPQPGLALLRLAQGDAASASAALRRALGETAEPIRRVALLPAAVEVLVAVGDLAQARDAADELAGYCGRLLELDAAARSSTTRRERSRSRRTTRSARSRRCVPRSGPGRSSTRPTRPRAPAC